jgi:hypothetical protein
MKGMPASIVTLSQKIIISRTSNALETDCDAQPILEKATERTLNKNGWQIRYGTNQPSIAHECRKHNKW